MGGAGGKEENEKSAQKALKKSGEREKSLKRVERVCWLKGAAFAKVSSDRSCPGMA